VLSELGLLGRTLVVVALGVLNARTDGEPVDCEGLKQKIADALALHMSAVAPGSAVGQLGDVAYCLLPVTGTVETALDKVSTIASDFLARTGNKLPAVIGIGPVACDPSQLGGSRMGADRVLRVLKSRGRSGQVATISEALSDALLLELGDIAAVRGTCWLVRSRGWRPTTRNATASWCTRCAAGATVSETLPTPPRSPTSIPTPSAKA
jgi:hypothetical protein